MIAGLAVAAIAIAGLILLPVLTSLEDDARDRKELDALLTLVCFLALGLAIIGVLRELYPELRKSKTMMGLLTIVPLLAFLVLTDRISAISGAGVSLTVASVGETNLSVGRVPVVVDGTPLAMTAACPDNQPVPFTVPDLFLPKVFPTYWPVFTLESQQAESQPARETPTPTPAATDAIERTGAPVQDPTYYWTMKLGLCEYDAGKLNEQLRALIETTAFQFILLVDRDDHFVAYIPVGNAEFLLAEYADTFVPAINNDRRDVLSGFTGIVFDALTTEDSTLAALARMQAQRLDMLPVLDKPGGTMQGVTTRNEVVAGMLLELAATSAD